MDNKCEKANDGEEEEELNKSVDEFDFVDTKVVTTAAEKTPISFSTSSTEVVRMESSNADDDHKSISFDQVIAAGAKLKDDFLMADAFAQMPILVAFIKKQSASTATTTVITTDTADATNDVIVSNDAVASSDTSPIDNAQIMSIRSALEQFCLHHESTRVATSDFVELVERLLNDRRSLLQGGTDCSVSRQSGGTTDSKSKSQSDATKAQAKTKPVEIKLSPEEIKRRTQINEGVWCAFASDGTAFSPIYPCEFKVGNLVFENLLQAFVYIKCKVYGQEYEATRAITTPRGSQLQTSSTSVDQLIFNSDDEKLVNACKEGQKKWVDEHLRDSVMITLLVKKYLNCKEFRDQLHTKSKTEKKVFFTGSDPYWSVNVKYPEDVKRRYVYSGYNEFGKLIDKLGDLEFDSKLDEFIANEGDDKHKILDLNEYCGGEPNNCQHLVFADRIGGDFITLTNTMLIYNENLKFMSSPVQKKDAGPSATPLIEPETPKEAVVEPEVGKSQEGADVDVKVEEEKVAEQLAPATDENVESDKELKPEEVKTEVKIEGDNVLVVDTPTTPSAETKEESPMDIINNEPKNKQVTSLNSVHDYAVPFVADEMSIGHIIENSDKYLDLIDPALLKTILIMVGANDLDRNVEDVKSEFQKLCSLIKTKFTNVKIYLSAVVPQTGALDDSMRRQNQALEAICSELEMTEFIDYEDISAIGVQQFRKYATNVKRGTLAFRGQLVYLRHIINLIPELGLRIHMNRHANDFAENLKYSRGGGQQPNRRGRGSGSQNSFRGQSKPYRNDRGRRQGQSGGNMGMKRPGGDYWGLEQQYGKRMDMGPPQGQGGFGNGRFGPPPSNQMMQQPQRGGYGFGTGYGGGMNNPEYQQQQQPIGYGGGGYNDNNPNMNYYPQQQQMNFGQPENRYGNKRGGGGRVKQNSNRRSGNNSRGRAGQGQRQRQQDFTQQQFGSSNGFYGF